MSQKTTTILIAAAIILGAVFIAGAIIKAGNNSQNSDSAPNSSQSPSPSSQYSASTLETFAKCLTEKGLVFYGAWWCPHCQNQKEMFGDAFQYVNYIECEKKPGQSRGQLVEACVSANIEGYPTWILPDGSRQTGEFPLESLSQISGCQLQ